MISGSETSPPTWDPSQLWLWLHKGCNLWKQWETFVVSGAGVEFWTAETATVHSTHGDVKCAPVYSHLPLVCLFLVDDTWTVHALSSQLNVPYARKAMGQTMTLNRYDGFIDTRWTHLPVIAILHATQNVFFSLYSTWLMYFVYFFKWHSFLWDETCPDMTAKLVHQNITHPYPMWCYDFIPLSGTWEDEG